MKKGKYQNTFYVIEDNVKINGKFITKNIKYLGTVEKILSNIQELDQFREKFGKSFFKKP